MHPLRVGIVREQFGRKAFGTIQGMVVAVITIGGLSGPVFAGWVFDSRGSYQLAWLGLIAALSVGTIASLAIKARR